MLEKHKKEMEQLEQEKELRERKYQDEKKLREEKHKIEIEILRKSIHTNPK